MPVSSVTDAGFAAKNVLAAGSWALTALRPQAPLPARPSPPLSPPSPPEGPTPPLPHKQRKSTPLCRTIHLFVSFLQPVVRGETVVRPKQTKQDLKMLFANKGPYSSLGEPRFAFS